MSSTWNAITNKLNDTYKEAESTLGVALTKETNDLNAVRADLQGKRSKLAELTKQIEDLQREEIRLEKSCETLGDELKRLGTLREICVADPSRTCAL